MLLNRFILHEMIGSGSHSQVYEAYDQHRHRKVAIKVFNDFNKDTRKTIENNIKKEIEVLTRIVEHKLIGYHKLYWYGHVHLGPILVLQLLGDSLSFRWHKSRGFGNIIAEIAPQMISRLQKIHDIGYLHCDQKPDNWMFGRGKTKNILHLIDFGYATSYRDNFGNHYEAKISRKFYGTHMYASPYVEFGYNYSRRDDMIALGYVLMSLFHVLPWADHDTNDHDWIKHLANKKLQTKFDQFSYPHCLLTYLNICLSMTFYERPPYKQLIELLS